MAFSDASGFPAATANHMLEHDIPAIYINLVEVGGTLKVVATEIPVKRVFNCGDRHHSNLYYAFESVVEPYQAYSFDQIDGIDLVIKDNGLFRWYKI